MSGVRKYFGLAIGAVLGAVVLASAQQVVGGHALDANLRVGSEGLNTARANAPGLSQPLYNPGLRSPVASRGSASGIQQPVYWTTTTNSASSRNQPRFSGATNGGATYATAAGMVYDPLAAPLYQPMSKPVQIQTGSGTLEVNTGQQSIAATRYRPVR